MSTPGARAVKTVVKIGGSLLSRVEVLDAVLTEVAAASAEVPLLVVPGGGRFADTVRQTDQSIGLGEDAAHWMAVLAMDQYSHLVAARLVRGRVVFDRTGVATASAAGAVPVLAPFQWLWRADPLPHSWDVTSDSIAAWVAARLDAARLVVIKHAGASGPSLVDPVFHCVLPGHIAADIVTADRLDSLRALLRQPAVGSRQ